MASAERGQGRAGNDRFALIFTGLIVFAAVAGVIGGFILGRIT